MTSVRRLTDWLGQTNDSGSLRSNFGRPEARLSRFDACEIELLSANEHTTLSAAVLTTALIAALVTKMAVPFALQFNFVRETQDYSKKSFAGQTLATQHCAIDRA